MMTLMVVDDVTGADEAGVGVGAPVTRRRFPHETNDAHVEYGHQDEWDPELE